MKKSSNATKPPPARQPSAETTKSHVLAVRIKPGEDPAAAAAQSHLDPCVQAAVSVRAFNYDTGPDLNALNAALTVQAEAVRNGDMGRAEAILIAQAHSLDAMFGYLARRAVSQTYLPQYEAHMRLALKAQAQCARTLEVLGNLKNPAPVAFVRQANIGNAVQVNNTLPSRAQERIPNQSNELLGANNGERLEQNAQGATIGAHSGVAAVDPINRTQDGQR